MQRLLLPLLSIVAFAGPLESISFARRGIPITIIWGHGESISNLGTLPSDVGQSVSRELGKEVSVGFLYGHMHVFYADLWTWNGRHVLYNGDQYWELHDAQWEMLLGSSARSKFGIPLHYRFPVGLTLLLTIIAGFTLHPIVFPSEQKKLQKLYCDPRYTAAVESVFANDSHGLQTVYEDDRLQSAISLLVSQGISESKARRNLEKILSAVCSQREMWINDALNAARHLAEIGQITDSEAILQQLVEKLPPSDARRELVIDLLATLKEAVAQRAESATCETCGAGIGVGGDGTCPSCRNTADTSRQVEPMETNEFLRQLETEHRK